MPISKKTTGSIYLFFFSKGAYPIVRQLEKITVKKNKIKKDNKNFLKKIKKKNKYNFD